MSQRYHFPLPFGWFQVAYSSDLEPGQSKALSYFGQELVIFRTETGTPKVLDAYCPHLGAHLGHGVNKDGGGGRVEGETIVCPFHSWKFDGEGFCKEVPYATNMPPKAANSQCIKSWPTVERNQIIWVWYHPDNTPPLWQVETIDEARPDNNEWGKLKSKRWRISTVAQEITENAVDFPHFTFVHGVASDPNTETQWEGHKSTRIVNVDLKTPRGDVKGGIYSYSIGPGQGYVRFTGICETLGLGNLTPIDEETVEVNFSFLQQKVNGEEPQGGVQQAIVDDICKQWDEDTIIWSHKRYREKPMLCDGDGPISQFRKWYAQFYASQ